MNVRTIMITLTALFICACSHKDKNIPIAHMQTQIVDKVALSDPVIIDLKDNIKAGERYGISPSVIVEGFVYTNKENELSVDEIIVINAVDRKAVKELEDALDREVTDLKATWEDIDKNEHKKIQKHVLKSNKNYVILAVCDKSKEVEQIFDNYF